MFTILTLCFLIAISAIFFWYRTLIRYRIGNFPSPPGYFLLGHAPYLSSTDKMMPFVYEKLIENKGFLKIYFGPIVTLFVSDKEFLKWIFSSSIHITKVDEYRFMKGWLGEGLISANGAHWRLHRKILTPAFHFKMIENHISALSTTTSILIEKLRKHVGKSSVDIYPLIASFSLDSVCESTMATSMNAQEEDNSEYQEAIHHLCRIFYERFCSIFKRSEFLFKFHPDYKISKHAIECVNSFTKAVMKNRRIELNNSRDLVKENIYQRKKTPFLDILLNYKDLNNESLSDQDILDEVNTIIFAGFETSAVTISFALYNLANNPDVQNRAFEEQKLLFGSEKNPVVTYRNLNDMKYLDTVLKESLRLHPTIPGIGRKITEDTYYDGKLLPAGLTVILSLYTLHHDPELFPEPEKFDPSRFENETNLTPYTFLPFSAGQRNCLGQKFAMSETKQVVSAILRNFELLPDKNHSLELVTELSLKSSNGICIGLKQREY